MDKNIIAQKAVTAANQKAVNADGQTAVALTGNDPALGERSVAIAIYSATGDTANVVTARRLADDKETVLDSLVVTKSQIMTVPHAQLWEFECTTFSSNFLLTVSQ